LQYFNICLQLKIFINICLDSFFKDDPDDESLDGRGLHSGRARHGLRPGAKLDLRDERVFENETASVEMKQVGFGIVENEK
jgi:hypothetical protein